MDLLRYGIPAYRQTYRWVLYDISLTALGPISYYRNTLLEGSHEDGDEGKIMLKRRAKDLPESFAQRVSV